MKISLLLKALIQLQGKSLNNQIYRLIDAAITSKATHSTPAQSVISPTAENQVNDTSVNDIVDKSTPSINRSLRATSMAGIKTTTRFFTIGNSSLNAKFEALKSKLCGTNIAIKSYFMDELQLLKNKATVNKKQDCNINTEETTTLKNKIKLLELENKLLKDDVTNKQRSINTIL